MFSPQPWLFKIHLQSVYKNFPSDENPNHCAFHLVRVWSLESLVNDLVEKYPHILTLGSASAQGKRMVQCLARPAWLLYKKSNMATHRNILKQHGFCFSSLQLRRVLDAPRDCLLQWNVQGCDWTLSANPCINDHDNPAPPPRFAWRLLAHMVNKIHTSPLYHFIPMQNISETGQFFWCLRKLTFWPVDFIWMQQHTGPICRL